MEGLAQIQEAIEATGQEEIPEAKDIDVNKELQSFIDSIGGLEFANNKDFKAAATDIIKALVEWYAELQQQYDKDRDDLTTTLQDRFKKMDEAITELFEFTESVENLRFFLPCQPKNPLYQPSPRMAPMAFFPDFISLPTSYTWYCKCV